jgi:hypothetical protein
MESAKGESIYRIAAFQGLLLGLWLTAISACTLAGIRVPVLNFAVMPMLIAMVFIQSHFFAYIVSVNTGYARFSVLWMAGIIQFLGASLLCSLLTAAYMIIVEPGFLNNYFSEALHLMEQSDMAGTPEYNTLKDAIDMHIIPSATQYVSMMFWLTSLFGSIMSMILASILPRTKFFFALAQKKRMKNNIS